ncbi:haloacid dehalogenase type II [Nocardioides sp. TRM66260-LWL]|uniref:haloacid dehalogenase type II n=1 Tax=Nocardioides sp. TRM66260-LWL TaxID=2874478 RepID=UPI001CC49C59|nr:haloacid dehalogenase type II [Nocardioides sp. TRM66260-LWL]MBZ5734145.1 haloacid dehalogenase type II [Nocardioides sp. TRM66260-LWL]
MPTRPALILFDVNETLSDMAPLAGRFEDVGAPGGLARTWFASVLRDGVALTAAGASARFAEVADGCLRVALHGVALDRPLDEAVEHVLAGFAELHVHPDVAEGLEALAGLGIRLVTLSNGAASVAEALLGRAGARAHVEACLSVEDAEAAGPWKPAAEAYARALRRCGVRPEEAMLVAVHPWDVDGAARAGLRTAWIDRDGSPYPRHAAEAELTASSLVDLARRLR